MTQQQTLKVMISEEELAERIQALGAEIQAHYKGQPVAVIGVLKGCFLFLADLCRELHEDVTVDFLGLSSYSGTASTGVVRLTSDLKVDIQGRHVLIVEDIVDTGLTMQYLLKMLKTREPASLAVCTLLDKPSRRKASVHVDFCGFSIQDRFVVGYGLDLDERYRNLPYIAEVLFD